MGEWLPVITAVVSSVTTLAVCLINNAATRRSSEAKQNETINLITYKIENLTKKVEEHNNLISRTYKLEEITSVLDEKIKVANDRIADLEHKEG